MTRMMRLYYYGVAGAIGGLIAWQLSNLIGLSFTPILYLNEMIVGAVIGLCIGVSIGLVEGVLRQNLVYSLRSVAVFAGLGAAGGAIGLPLAEGLFQLYWRNNSGAVVWMGCLRIIDRISCRMDGRSSSLEKRSGRFYRRADGRSNLELSPEMVIKCINGQSHWIDPSWRFDWSFHCSHRLPALSSLDRGKKRQTERDGICSGQIHETKKSKCFYWQ